MMITDAYNVTINNCGFLAFQTSINVTDSSLVTLDHINVHNSNYGIVFNNVSKGNIYNSSVNGTSNASILLYNTDFAKVTNAAISYGQHHNIAIYLNGSQNNTIENSMASHSYIGLKLSGKSLNNTILNNTMQSNTGLDYLCIGNSGINAENGGINYGITKSGCHWLAAITATYPKPECTYASGPSLFYLTQDYEYTTGTICYTSLSNYTTINCNGHTIIATKGGTFTSFKNSYGSKLENCYLKGFADTITAENSTISILNNTISENSTSTRVISVNDSRLGATIKDNNITAKGTGIYLANLGSGTLENNFVSGANTAYYLYNVTSMSIKNNAAYIDTLYGMILNRSVANLLQNNVLSSYNTGMLCKTGSQGQTNNTDLGNNACSKQSNCLWLKNSPQCQ